MEEYLLHQVREGGNDLLANLAILKLYGYSRYQLRLATRLLKSNVFNKLTLRYQFNPHLANPEIIVHILLKALSSSVAGPDFKLCLPFLREPAAIIRDAESDDSSLIVILPWLEELAALIRTCKFTEFWGQWNGSSEGAQGESRLLNTARCRVEASLPLGSQSFNTTLWRLYRKQCRAGSDQQQSSPLRNNTPTSPRLSASNSRHPSLPPFRASSLPSLPAGSAWTLLKSRRGSLRKLGGRSRDRARSCRVTGTMMSRPALSRRTLS